MTNPDTVERLRELLGKATEGPWVEHIHDIWTVRDDGQPGIPLLREVIGNYRSWGRNTSHEERGANAALIVEAINALPALLDAVEALEWYASQETYADGPSVSDVAWAPEIPALSDRGQRARTALATLKGEG